MSRLILKQHGITRLAETSPLAIGQSVAVLREAPVINWIKLRHMLGLDVTDWSQPTEDEWMSIAEAEEYDAQMAETWH